MSYLIGLYVYYHGNNLAAFGFVKGSEEIKDQNKGLKNEYENLENLRGSNIIPDNLINIIQEQERTRKENDYGELLRKAVIQSQAESVQLHQKGLINNNIIERTPDILLEEYYDDGNIPLDFFNELNGL